MKQQYGKTWWGEKWLQALHNIDYSNRLPRGASYARKGAVKQLDISDSTIVAKVAGSRPSPYTVDIVIPTFATYSVAKFISKLVTQPFIVSKLLNRELDPSLLDMAESAGLKVFPSQWREFNMYCSCPDSAVPCKHLASVVYKISEEIDNNPFLIFELHNLDLIEELNNRGVKVSTETVAIPSLEFLYFKEGQDSEDDKSNCFNPLNAYEKLAFSRLSSIQDSLYLLLSEKPVFYTNSADFKLKYTTVLNKLIRICQRILQGKVTFATAINQVESTNRKVTIHTDAKIVLNKNLEAFIAFDKENYSLWEFMLELSYIPSNRLFDYQASIASLHSLFQLALHLVANGAVVSQIVMKPNRNYEIRWLPALINSDVQKLVDDLSLILPPNIFLNKDYKSFGLVDKDTAINLLSVFITDLIKVLVGDTSRDFFQDLFFTNVEYSFSGPGEGATAGSIQTWLQKYYLSQGKYKLQLFVNENTASTFIVDIFVTGIASLEDVKVPLKDILELEVFESQRLDVLQTMSVIVEFIPGLDNYITLKGNQPLEFSNKAFTSFLFQMIPVIRMLNMDVVLPKSLHEILKPKPSVRLKSNSNKSYLNLHQLLSFDWQVAIGDTLMSEADFNKLLIKSDELLKFKSAYIYVGKDDLLKLHKHFSSAQILSSFEILRIALSGEYEGAKIELDNDVVALIKELTEIKEIPLPEHLNADLRPYQRRGYSWMYRNSKIGFGSVLADDMGLGKTLQVISTLLKYKEEGLLSKKKVLVIAPTGLLMNWQAEIEKFAPSLATCLFHGSKRKIDDDYDILLTSYGVVRTEIANLKKWTWYAVVIDEAQNIKNNDTVQAKAIKSLKADNFIAMSGTPVENRLSELWSILDYTNRGFLGSMKDFKDNFSNAIETYNDLQVAEKLKKVTAPFMMRRLKSDKTIISDLPDKIEMDVYGSLSSEQASLYEQTLHEAMRSIEDIDQTDSKELFKRQGLVLQMILALKQICNHPTQFLKNNKLEASLSGKMDLLFDKLDSIVESGEKVLIFTQFREMGDLLQHFIHERYKEKPMFYHGGTPLKQRNEMVDSFQNNPASKIFILSLKAAGTGLNLTAASHVIHYDLWWNPAVEAQATDRAYRIGQKSNVMVHRFITKNTFEERINTMIQAKKSLADMTVSTGENWIGNLSNRELKEIFEMK